MILAVAPDAGAPRRWRLPQDPSSLQWREWDDDVVVRVAATAHTHLLAPAAGGVFTALRDRPAGLDLHALAAAVIEDPVPADLDALRLLLVDLAKLGIVEALPA